MPKRNLFVIVIPEDLPQQREFLVPVQQNNTRRVHVLYGHTSDAASRDKKRRTLSSHVGMSSWFGMTLILFGTARDAHLIRLFDVRSASSYFCPGSWPPRGNTLTVGKPCTSCHAPSQRSNRATQYGVGAPGTHRAACWPQRHSRPRKRVPAD